MAEPPLDGDVEEGPDPNEVRRHAKKMLTEMEYRRKYRRIDFYKPNRKQLQFHNLLTSEKMLRAGNQEGKTHAGSAELAMDAISNVVTPLCASADPAGSALDTVEPIASYALPNVPGKRITIVRVFYGPGGFTRAHRHAGSVTA